MTEPEKDPPKRSPKQLTRLLALVRPYRGRFYLATVMLLLGSAVSLSYPQAARYAIDVSSHNRGTLNQMMLILMCVFVGHSVLLWFRHYLMSWLGERVVADLRAATFSHLLRLSLSWFQEQRSGALISRLSGDVAIIESAVGSELSMTLRGLLQLIGGIGLLFVVDAELTLYMLLIVPPVTIGGYLFGRQVRKFSRKLQDRWADTGARAQESVGAIMTVQAFTREEHEADRYRHEVSRAFSQALTLIRWRSTFFAAISTAGYVAVSAVIWLGGIRVLDKTMTAGELTAFLLYTAMVASSMGQLASLWGSLQRAAGATERVLDILATEPEIKSPEQPEQLPDCGGTFHLRDVSFRYPSRPNQGVLQNLTLEVAKGEVVAIVGPSGAGKSTIAALLLRFHDPDSGVVEVEGKDLRKLDLTELRRVIAIVDQEPVLLSGTIRDNIAYGRLDASDEAIEAAAKQAHAHEFVTGFSEGYQTLVGERGVALSGGQKQRVAIARALLTEPRILILDEATSNLDAESESLVQQAISEQLGTRTTMIIAHRLSTVKKADRIVVLDRGQIAQQGTHRELMDAGGVYKRLIEHQLLANDDSELK